MGNEILKGSEPEFVEEIPVRTEPTVLPADPPSTPIGWVIREYLGEEVYLLDADGSPIEEPLKSNDALKPGMVICAPTLVGRFRATVTGTEGGELMWVAGGLTGDLKFSPDDRECWVTTWAGNLGAVRKLCLEGPEQTG